MSREIERAIQTLAQVARDNEINCTGPGEVGCKGRKGWHSWADHRLHVAAAQAAALADQGLLASPANDVQNSVYLDVQRAILRFQESQDRRDIPRATQFGFIKAVFNNGAPLMKE